jgi:hypothetical protein
VADLAAMAAAGIGGGPGTTGAEATAAAEGSPEGCKRDKSANRKKYLTLFSLFYFIFL